MTTETSNNTEAKTKEAPQYRIDPKDIPPILREAVSNALGKDADVYPAKDGGSYKGRVLHADVNYIVQAIGRRESSAVVHTRSEIEVKGASLVSRAANDDLTDRNVQIHYRDRGQEGAAMYSWNPQKEAEQRTARAADRAASASDRMIEEAKTYAAENIKTPKARENFMQHFGAVMEQAQAKREQGRTQQSEQEQKPKEAAGIER